MSQRAPTRIVVKERPEMCSRHIDSRKNLPWIIIGEISTWQSMISQRLNPDTRSISFETVGDIFQIIIFQECDKLFLVFINLFVRRTTVEALETKKIRRDFRGDVFRMCDRKAFCL